MCVPKDCLPKTHSACMRPMDKIGAQHAGTALFQHGTVLQTISKPLQGTGSCLHMPYIGIIG